MLSKMQVLAALAAASLPAVAGQKITAEVVIGSTSANGGLGAARNSADTTQIIYCGLDSLTYGTDGYCYARNAAGVPRVCYTDNPNHLDVIKHLGGDGYVQFSWTPESECTRVFVANSSAFETKR